jgi:S-methylmethionine-dependent homocysteine/selenocysteine methylase
MHGLQGLREDQPVLLDGALGTELEARGFDLPLPLWTARAVLERADLVWEIHRDSVEAGADVLTAGTFRTSRHGLAKAGLEARSGELTLAAVRLARSACSAATRPVFIAGSIAPLEDCYRPDLAPDDETLAREHLHHAAQLAKAGVDLLLVETQNSAREALAAARAALGFHLPVWVSLLPKNASELLNGDALRPLTHELFALGINALLVNCASPEIVRAAYSTLRAEFGDRALGGYPNLLNRDVSPAEFAQWCRTMQQQGANIIGGCCGCGPELIAAARGKK